MGKKARARSGGFFGVVCLRLSTQGFFEFNDFINKCYESLDMIKVHADTIGVFVGSPAINPVQEGKDLFNAAFFFMKKK